VKHALNRHDASLSIASELGVGSTFTCRFPSASGLWRQAADLSSDPAANC
jgi:two-component system phosphate regulon sensor histidine kinase PhoR